MPVFRFFLATLFLALSAYTLVVGWAHGWNLIPFFFAEIQAMTWQGQFNFDFMGFLLLSATWCVWRHQFSPLGWAFAILGATGGILFLSVYLLVLSYTTKGDIKAMMLGPCRANA